MALAGVALVGCDSSNPRQMQGWVEAEMIFVSPDEQGRVETLKVREGDRVKRGDLIISIEGKPVNNIQDYMYRMSQVKRGEKISVEVMRNNQKRHQQRS